MNRHPQSDVIWKSLRNPDCKECSLCETAQTVCLLGDGPVPCDGMAIGEAPGFREDSIEIPFSGESGKLLRKTLKEIGIDPRTIYITNTVACRPPNNRTPNRIEVKTCAPLYLLPQIEKVNPRAVLLLGNTALSAITGKKGGITKLEGSTFKIGDITYVPSRHPSSLLRTEGTEEHKYLLQQFKENLLLFKRTLFPTEDNFRFIDRVPEDAELQGQPIYLDIETNGLNPYKLDAKIWCMAIQAKNSDEVFCFRNLPEYYGRIRYILKRHRIMAQRGTFEGTWVRKHFKLLITLYHDTKLGSYLIDENEQSGLKYQAIKWLNVEPWSEEQNWNDPDFDTLLPYNARDTKYGLDLYKHRDLPHLKKHPRQARLLRYILLPAEELFIDIIHRGFHIDVEQAEQKLRTCQENKARINDEINEIAGRAINPGSPKQMANLLYSDLRLRCPVKTSKGANSTSEAALIRLQGQHPIIDLQLDWRKWQKYASSYLTPWLARGPILHAGYDFTGTVTGRLSSSMVKDKRGEKKLGGTLHQCPRDGFIRNLVCPRDPDWCLLVADLSQIELRLVAHHSNDPLMVEIFRNSALPAHCGEGHQCPDCDIHLATAMGLVRGEITKEMRKRAKAVNFGFVYGMWAPKFQRYAKEKYGLDLTLQESENYRESFFDKYAGLLPWHNRVEAFVSRNGWIDSVFARRRHLPEALLDNGYDDWIQRKAVREGINAPIQSAGSDLDLLIASLMCSRSLPWDFKIPSDKAFLVGAAHDSLIFECQKSWAEKLKAGILYTVQNLPVKEYFDFNFRVPIKMDVAIYRRHWEGEEL